MGPERSPALRSIVRRYYGFQVFFALLFWIPIHYEFQRRIGLSDASIFEIQSIYYLAFCLLQVPTGLFSDKVGHLRSMRLGTVALVASSALPVFAPSHAGMLWHFVLLALARAFVMGPSSAYLYVQLAELGDTDDFKIVEGRARAYGLLAKLVSWAAVGFMLEWHWSAPYWATTAASLLAGAYAWALPPARVRSAPTSTRSLELGGALGVFRAKPMLGLVMLQGVAIFVIGRVVQTNLFQPILGERGYPVEAYGLVMAAMALFEAGGSAFPQAIRKWLSDLDAVFVLSVLTAFTLSAIALSGPVGGFVALAIFSFATGLAYPIQRQLVSDTIPDERYRATLLSLESIVDRGVNAWVVIYLADFVATGRMGELLHIAAAITVVVMLALQIGARLLARRERSPAG